MLRGSEEKKVIEVSSSAKTKEKLADEDNQFCQEVTVKAGCKWLQSGDCVISNKRCLKL